MSILTWLILGLIAGYVGSRIVNRHGAGLIGDVALGIIGALVGGGLFHLIGERGVTGLNLWSLVVAVVGSVVLLVALHLVRGALRSSH